MKAIATDALIVELVRQGISIIDERMGSMKGRIETSDLQGLRKGPLRRADAG